MEEKVNVCILDFENEDIKKIKSLGLEVYNGSAGTRVKITYLREFESTKYCLLNVVFPSNLHEYRVLVVNMINEKVIPYYKEDHQSENVQTDGEVKLEITRPTNIFDPRPYFFNLLQRELQEFSLNPSIVVVFADKEYEITYQPVYFSGGSYPKSLEKEKYSNYSFLPSIQLKRPKNGTKSKVVADKKVLNNLLLDFNDLEYHQTFSKPEIWNEEIKNKIPDPNFHTLIVNDSNEIISYAYKHKNTVVFIFPDIKEKEKFTSRFLTEIAPDILPDLFSSSNEISWLSDKKYWLPGHNKLIERKEEEINRHEKELEKIEKELEENNEKFKVLHDLITETDDKLVNAVLFILHYLGFKNAKKVDETKLDGMFEEDIQLEYKGMLLVIEVKGIGGTSKDSECSQVSKIRYRRMKERNSTNVCGLYIVNHERFKPPHKRSNPPFNRTQIQDAINDDRGLLTTWDLYKLYHDIENGIILKDQTIDSFFEYGLIDFRKKLIKIAKVDKIYREGSIASFELSGIEIRKENEIISEKNGLLKKHKVISIEQNSNSLDSASEGRTGIAVEPPLEVNSVIFKNNK